MAEKAIKEKTKEQMAEIEKLRLETPVECLVLRQHWAVAHGEKQPRLYLPGEKYKLSGMDLKQVIATRYCTLDLKEAVPANPKRRISPEGEVIVNNEVVSRTKDNKKFNDPVESLTSRIDRLIDLIENKLVKK